MVSARGCVTGFALGALLRLSQASRIESRGGGFSTYGAVARATSPSGRRAPAAFARRGARLRDQLTSGSPRTRAHGATRRSATSWSTCPRLTSTQAAYRAARAAPAPLPGTRLHERSSCGTGTPARSPASTTAVHAAFRAVSRSAFMPAPSTWSRNRCQMTSRVLAPSASAASSRSISSAESWRARSTTRAAGGGSGTSGSQPPRGRRSGALRQRIGSRQVGIVGPA